MTAEQFTTSFLQALRGAGVPSFRRKFRDVRVLLIDDLQFFLGKRATLLEVLHTVDGFVRDGRQLVLAADRAPGEMPDLGRDLVTRLREGLVCRIDPPEFETRLAIVRQIASRLALEASEEVWTFVAARAGSNARELTGAVRRLQTASRALEAPVTLAMAEEQLADLVQEQFRPVRMDDIAAAVGQVFGLDQKSVVSPAREKAVTCARMVAMWLARKHTHAPYSEIGEFFGRRRHSTVVAAQGRVDGWVKDGATLALSTGRFAVDEAVRKIEARLAAG
jgi:chromosomal replication initiator protein